jgi:hypothetical protein
MSIGAIAIEFAGSPNVFSSRQSPLPRADAFRSVAEVHRNVGETHCRLADSLSVRS